MIDPAEAKTIELGMLRAANSDRLERINGVISLLCAIAGLEQALGIGLADRTAATEWRYSVLGKLESREDDR